MAHWFPFPPIGDEPEPLSAEGSGLAEGAGAEYSGAASGGDGGAGAGESAGGGGGAASLVGADSEVNGQT